MRAQLCCDKQVVLAGVEAQLCCDKHVVLVI
jgi:hypothetical protein